MMIIPDIIADNIFFYILLGLMYSNLNNIYISKDYQGIHQTILANLFMLTKVTWMHNE